MKTDSPHKRGRYREHLSLERRFKDRASGGAGTPSPPTYWQLSRSRTSPFAFSMGGASHENTAVRWAGKAAYSRGYQHP